MIKLITALQYYQDHCYTLAPRTRKIYYDHLNRLLVTVGSDLQVKEIGSRDLTRFMANLRDKDGKSYSKGYQDQIYRTLHTFFEYCVRESWLTVNPMRSVPKPGCETGPKPRLQLNQVEELIIATKKKPRCMNVFWQLSF